MSVHEPLLRVEALSVHYPIRHGDRKGARTATGKAKLRAVDGLTLQVQRGQTLGLVGESGCGKSTAARAMLQLERPTGGKVYFDGQELTGLWRRTVTGGWRWSKSLRDLRRRMQLVFQDPHGSLDPRMNVEEIIGEPLRAFEVLEGTARRKRVQELMARVGLDSRFVRRYPHQFSGGQRQRIGIARALALEPELIVADEPVSALDVSVQAQVINLLRELQQDLGLTYVFIAHDLSVVRHISDRIAVMYLGSVVEEADCEALCSSPAHPYTRALVSAVPIPDPAAEALRQPVRLQGEVPSPIHRPPGCPFHPRCPQALEECASVAPADWQVASTQWAACHLHARQDAGA